jgi:hypothetical protein
VTLGGLISAAGGFAQEAVGDFTDQPLLAKLIGVEILQHQVKDLVAKRMDENLAKAKLPEEVQHNGAMQLDVEAERFVAADRRVMGLGRIYWGKNIPRVMRQIVFGPHLRTSS